MRLVGGDYGELLHFTQSCEGFARCLEHHPTGLLLQTHAATAWLLAVATNLIAPSHREGHAAFVAGVVNSAEFRQIGERMFLAEKTVKNYVSHLLAKLGLERRTQAAVLATELRSGPGASSRPR